MFAKVYTTNETVDKPSQSTGEALSEQILWFIRLRWVAVGGIVVGALVGSHVFPVLITPVPIYVCAMILLLCNVLYYLLATKKTTHAGPKETVFGTVQAEIDLVLLTVVLHFSGGVVNPFFLFYFFPVITATIMLPRNLSFGVGLTAIALFGLLAANELNGGAWLGHYPLQFSVSAALWKNQVFILGAFTAFVSTVILAQYLTRIVIVRMTAKEAEAARNNDLLKAVISAMGEGLIFIRCDGNVTICNPAANLWKKDNGAETDANPLDSFPTTLAAYMKGLLTAPDRAKIVGKVIEFNTTGPERRYIEAKTCPVVGINGQKLGYVIVGRDLTDHKKLEKDLLERTEDVTQINEMLKMSRIEMAQREKMVAIG